MRETQLSARSITSSFTTSFDIWKTFTTRKQLKRQQVNLLCFGYEPKLHQKLVKYIKEVNVMIRRIELLKVKIAATEAAINAWNICKDQSAQVLQTGGILYVKEARSMTCNRLDLENLRQKARDERTEKQYINELKKVYKSCKIYIKVWQMKEKAWKALYKVALKELLVIQPFQK